MKKSIFAVWMTTLFLVFYTILPFTNPSVLLISSLFCVSPFITLWMVYNILKFDKPSERTFESHFYDCDNSPIPTK